jgi:flagellar hook-basal body complex protein FliE
MSIGGIEALSGFTPLAAPVVASPSAASAPTRGVDFGNMVLDGLERLEGVQDTADTLAVRAASARCPTSMTTRWPRPRRRSRPS